MLDYQVLVIDPREEYADGWDLPGVPLERGMPDDVLAAGHLDGHSAVVALTHDPKIDDLALMEALKSPAFYVGAIGSKKNNDARRLRLKEFDLSEGEIARLKGPVGLYIGSKTPPEIAVAILAEMTAVRHGVAEPSWAAKPAPRFDPSACEVKTQQGLKVVAILLAAGSARRFGSDKLRHALPHDVPIAIQAARNLKAVFGDSVLAVIRPDATELAGLFARGRLQGDGVRARRRGHGREPRLRRTRGQRGRARRRLRRRARRHALHPRQHHRGGARRARRRSGACRAVLSRAPGTPGGHLGHVSARNWKPCGATRGRGSCSPRTPANWSRSRWAIPARSATSTRRAISRRRSSYSRSFRMENVQRAVLFVDVTDSTRLYESLGDTVALALINGVFERLEKIVAKYAGTVVKSLGDGIICVFEDPDNAFRAAVEIQTSVRAAAQETATGCSSRSASPGAR